MIPSAAAASAPIRSVEFPSVCSTIFPHDDRSRIARRQPHFFLNCALFSGSARSDHHGRWTSSMRQPFLPFIRSKHDGDRSNSDTAP
jgi:hypothetical protein